MAAVLACGEGAMLSHRSAAALWALLPPTAGPVDVSTPARSGRRRRPGIRLHRCVSLSGRPIVRRHGIPVTTPARTIADLRGAVPAWQWRRAVRQAEISGLRLGPEVKTDRTRSDLERDFLLFCRRYGLPRPEVNLEIGRWTVDFVWRDRQVAVETGTYAFHRGTIAFEDDHARDLDLRRRGYDVRRFTYRQVRDEPVRVAEDLRDALGLSS
jgi:very-short-patch-repair endonuclease